MEQSHSFNLPGDFRYPPFQVNLGRINVILGANGAGKSATLRRLLGMAETARSAIAQGSRLVEPAPFDGRPVVFIEGGRVIRVPESFGRPPRGQETAEANYAAARIRNLADRLSIALQVFEERAETAKQRRSDAVDAWVLGGQQGTCPAVEEQLLPRLERLFHGVFPELTLQVSADRQIRMRKGDSIYLPETLSSGEAQVLALLTDLALLAPPDSVILADEPELNLHAQLADRFWTRLESDLPEATFIYATHSIPFAMRSSVSTVIALSPAGCEALTLSDLSQLDREDLRPFLGAFARVIGQKVVLATEGDAEKDDGAFDARFYNWLVGGRASVQTLGDCEAVERAVRHAGLWEKVRLPGLKMLGVIDRDYRSDETIKACSEHCLVLELHEAESYLCHPRLLADFAEKLGTPSPMPTVAELHERLHGWAKARLANIVAQRTFHRKHIRLGLSVKRAELAGAKDVDAVRAVVIEAARRELMKAQELDEGKVVECLDEEAKRLARALDGNDPIDLLALVPGKEFLGSIAHRVRCHSPAEVLNGVIKHLDPESYPHLKKLRDTLIARLPTDGA